MNPFVIRAVAFQEDGMWVARCIDYNFASCAETLDELADELLRQVLDQIEADRDAGQEPFFGYKAAPKKYWDMFAAAEAVSRPIENRKRLPQRDPRQPAKVETQLIPVAA